MPEKNDKRLPEAREGPEEAAWNFEVVLQYTRAQAIEDGVLIDVTDQAKEAGITIPVALTRAVWTRYVALTPAETKAGKDEEGRIWDILWMFRTTALREPKAREIHFELHVTTDHIAPSLVALKALLTQGDQGEAVLTILLPEED